MELIRLLIVDDHPVVRAGLQGMLSSQPDFEVVGEAKEGAEAIALAKKHKPDVVLMDLSMPGVDGVVAIREIKAEHTDIHILVLTTYDSDIDIIRAIEAGATSYLLKDSPREDLFRAIRSAAQGEAVIAPRVAARLMRHVRTPAEGSLTSRETEVLNLVSKGNSNKQIASQFHISEATVKTHLVHTFGKLGVDDRTAAVTEALKRGILRLDS